MMLLYYVFVTIIIISSVAFIVVALWDKNFRNVKYTITILFLVMMLLLLLGITCTVRIIDFMKGGDYWSSQGDYDTYRMPLEYPYELFMIDEIRSATIRTWPGSKQGLWIDMYDIQKVFKQENLLFGETGHSSGKGFIWFIFNCESGRLEEFKAEEEFWKRAKELGFLGEPKLIPIKEYWDSFWSNPKNWRGKEIPDS